MRSRLWPEEQRSQEEITELQDAVHGLLVADDLQTGHGLGGGRVLADEVLHLGFNLRKDKGQRSDGSSSGWTRRNPPSPKLEDRCGRRLSPAPCSPAAPAGR